MAPMMDAFVSIPPASSPGLTDGCHKRWRGWIPFCSCGLQQEAGRRFRTLVFSVYEEGRKRTVSCYTNCIVWAHDSISGEERTNV